jgi:polysaccharide export outer membrane protein
VLQALAIAGGPTPFAASSRIQIRRRDENGGETVRLFDYETIEEGAGHELLLVGHGDVVVVPERGLFE